IYSGTGSIFCPSYNQSPLVKKEILERYRENYIAQELRIGRMLFASLSAPPVINDLEHRARIIDFLASMAGTSKEKIELLHQNRDQSSIENLIRERWRNPEEQVANSSIDQGPKIDQ
ncbi:MAG: hypothetical protein AAFX93_04755, partial [Verrucomicrobiota bacterium]